jgi:hypothetical protein
MSRGSITSAEALRNRAAAQAKIRRVCSCGRIVHGNPGWWSHTHLPDGSERPGHKFAGTGR